MALRWLAALLAALLVAPAPGAAQVRDPAREALARGDVYVHPRAREVVGPEGERRLRAAAARLSRADRPVKLAVVAGPAGAPSMRLYARRLAGRLGTDVTLSVTAPGRTVVAISPLPPAQVTRRLRAERVGAIQDPVERVVRAAELAAPVTPSGGEGDNVRKITGLIGLGLLGALWAVAWGLRREGRRGREQLAEARAAMRVYLDALRARALALARGERLPPADRAEVERALGTYAEALAAMQHARATAEVEALAPRVREGLEAVARIERGPAGDPFAGLCAVDPAHGPATDRAITADDPDPVPVCALCREAADRGQPASPRRVPRAGRPVPHREVALPGGVSAAPPPA